MKNKHLLTRIGPLMLLLALIFGHTTGVKATQLSGTYTIDSAGTPSATVFRDFNSAIIYMTGSAARPDGGPSNTTPFGVSGPVVFEVMQGTYTQQVNIPAITGASATNTITFDGGQGNAETRILQFTAASATDAHTLRFSSCSWVNVRNLTIRANGTTGGIAVHFFGANTTNNAVRHCRILAPITTSTSVRCIMATNSNLSSTGGGCSGSSTTISNIFIDSNYIFGGQTAIFLSSSVTSGGTFNFFVRKNIIENCSSVGIGASTSGGYLYHDNYIKMAPNNTTSIGIQHCNGSIASGTMQYVITSNIIENAGQYGIRFQSNNPNSGINFPTVIANNYIKPTFSNASCWGMDFSQPRNHKVYNNTVIMNMPNGGGINLNSSANPNCAVKNNIIMLRANNATNLCINSGAANIDSAEYNVYIKNNPDPSTNILNLRGTTFSKVNFKGGLGLNLNSTLDDPLLLSDSLPKPGNICQKGERLWYVTHDLFGDTRPDPPQIGCSEAAGGVSVDVSMVDIIEPVTYPVTAGTQTVKVRIKNNGVLPLTNATVSVQLGQITASVIYSGSLGTCEIDTVEFSGANALTLNAGTNVMRAWVYNALDTLNGNDTIQATFCTPLPVGTYTIDTGIVSATNFRSFGELAAVLNCGGISGTGVMEFIVSRGVYTDQLNLNAINGLSADARIIFRSADNNADSVELNYFATGAGDNFVVKLTNTSFVTFRDMTFRAVSTSFGRVFEFTGTVNNDTIENCKIIMPAVATTSTNFVGIWANPALGKLNYINNNQFTGGGYGVYWFGSNATNFADSNQISNNLFSNQYYMGTYTSFNYNIKILRNTINPNLGLSSFYGIYVTNSNFVEVANNKITPWNGGYGYFFSGVSGTAQNPSRMYNNTLAGGLTGTSYGIYLSSTTFTEIYHNTIYLTGTAATSYAGYFVLTGTANNTAVIRNNILANMGTGAANYAMYAWSPTIVNVNNNNIFTRGANLVQVASPAAATYPNVNIWRTISSFDKTSVSYAPGLTSNTNAEPNPGDSSSWSINGQGIYLPAYYQMDQNNNPRPQNPYQGAPDLGAIEFEPTAIAPMATFNPATLAPDSTTIFMFAGDTVAKIKWDVSSFPPQSGFEVRRYAGVVPPAVDTALGHMKFYTSVWGPFGSFSYQLSIMYKDMWLGNIPNESSIRMARRDTLGFNSWLPYNGTLSAVDTVNNAITTNSLFDFTYNYTGTDDLNSLPVRLSNFTAKRSRDNVQIDWTTAQEINSAKFEIERSFNGRTFETIGSTRAAGNSNRLTAYAFTDYNPLAVQRVQVIYYRLKMVDRDNTFEYSNTVPVRFNERGTTLLYPNPFKDVISIETEIENNAKASVEVYDIAGSKVFEKAYELASGNSVINVNELSGYTNGVYLIKVSVNNNQNWFKVVKE